MQALTKKAIFNEIATTFPRLCASEKDDYIRIGSEVGFFTDGPLLFNDLCPKGYDGGVNDLFTKWLEDRGWYLENYDGQIFMLFPIHAAQSLGAYS